jgi:septum formation protein
MSKRLTRVALASRSPRRKFLLESLGLGVEVVATSYDEGALTSLKSPAETVLQHALGKARCAAQTGPSILIAADTLVAVENEMLGKPRDADHARAMLRKLAGRRHQVFTGFVVADRERGEQRSGVESTIVHFLPLSEAEINAYVSSGEPLDKAGAYGIFGRGALLVESVSGDFYTVVGLPLARLGASLRELGYPPIAS